jgi:hypothetical protein
VTPLRGTMIFLQRKINTLPHCFPSKPQDGSYDFFFPPRRRGYECRSSLFLKPVNPNGAIQPHPVSHSFVPSGWTVIGPLAATGH